MALATISNSTFDTALGLVAAPYGPLTRSGTTTNLDTTPGALPNSMISYEVVGQGSVHLFVSYEELTNPAVLNAKLREAYGLAFRYREALLIVEALFRTLNTVSPISVTADQYQDMIHLFQYLVPIIGQLNPKFSYSELSNANAVVANFTISTAPDASHRTVVNTTTGLATDYFWDWGDGTFSVGEDPAPHQYLVDANPVYVRLIAFGPGGVDIKTSAAQNVNVP